MIKRETTDGGFALLYAVLMVSIVLAVSLSLLNIAYRQSVLTAIARESLVAGSAAETGLACALYYNASSNSNDDTSGTDKEPFGMYYQSDPTANWAFLPGTVNTIKCRDASDTTDLIHSNGSGAPPWPGSSVNFYRSAFALKFSDGSCAAVKVTKYFGSSIPTLAVADQVDILVEGYSFSTGVNATSGECEIAGARIVERTLRARVNH